jgi:SAM-dependent methyltransferase
MGASDVVDTPHFRVRGGVVTPRLPDMPVDNELADHIAAELVPLGVVPDATAFERVFVETVLAAAVSPERAWARFYRNTLRRLRRPGPDGCDSVSTFGRIYARVSALIRGTTVLDVGCCFGFLPIMLAERDPRLAIAGCDVVPGTAALADRTARSLGCRTRFIAADAARLPARSVGVDTVLAVHVLEHLPAAATAGVLAELCRVARRRVVVAVPLEDAPDPTYGHLQAFDLRSLAELGEASGWSWTVQDYEGGWLILDRSSTPAA